MSLRSVTWTRVISSSSGPFLQDDFHYSMRSCRHSGIEVLRLFAAHDTAPRIFAFICYSFVRYGWNVGQRRQAQIPKYNKMRTKKILSKNNRGNKRENKAKMEVWGTPLLPGFQKTSMTRGNARMKSRGVEPWPACVFVAALITRQDTHTKREREEGQAVSCGWKPNTGQVVRRPIRLHLIPLPGGMSFSVALILGWPCVGRSLAVDRC
ncbi:hypothetical protein V8C44DRAFT_191998 [Trichoderma aethiopicum]